MDLKSVRRRIDEIDRSIMRHIEERMALALRTKVMKGSVTDQSREQAVIDNVTHAAASNVRREFIERIFREIMAESKRLQGREKDNPHAKECTGRRIAIVGCGHMGSWFARELSRDNAVAVFDTDRRKLEQLGLPDAGVLPELAALEDFQPELMLNAVSIQHTVPVFESACVFIPEDCIIADIASIKGTIPEYYRSSPLRFVSIHPMFGPRFTDMHDIRNENTIVITESDEEGKGFFVSFLGTFGIRVFEYSFAEHDELMAYALTLPFASSIVFSACINRQVVPGTTFAKHKLIAQRLFEEDDFLLAEVLFNRYSLNQLEIICSKLEFLKHVIRARDHEEAQRFFKCLRGNVGS